MHFLRLNTAAGEMHVNASHIVRITPGNAGYKLVMSDGYTVVIRDPIESVLMDVYHPLSYEATRITLLDNETA